MTQSRGATLVGEVKSGQSGSQKLPLLDSWPLESLELATTVRAPFRWRSEWKYPPYSVIILISSQKGILHEV